MYQRRVFSATPTCSHKKGQSHNFLLIFKYYFTLFCIAAMNDPSSYGDAKIFKILSLGFFMGGGRGKWVGVAEHPLPHTPQFEVGAF